MLVPAGGEGPGASGSPRIGVVVIGRNEGDRLVAALEALAGCGAPVVYVDSGSSDGSAERARGLADAVIELDPALPFTAARGRNEGHAWLRAHHPGLEWVQFVDGDTVLHPDWLERAAEALASDPTIAAVAGALDEQQAERSRYARLLRMEWAASPGDTDACGGVAAYRSQAFEQVGGFAADLAAGEEPELCGRLRRAGHRIVRIAAPMGVHRGEIGSFGAWWRRAVRGGEAALEGAWRGGWRWGASDWRRLASSLLWGLVIPLGVAGAVAASLLVGRPTLVPAFLAAAAAGYGLQWLRIRRGMAARGENPRDARLYATYCLLAKPAGSLGVARALVRRGSARFRPLAGAPAAGARVRSEGRSP